MPEEQFRQLVRNLAHDGVLTSAPLIYKGEVLSGNHRVQAAIEAGIETALCIEITTELSEAQRVAIQLSHNALVGQDDPNILAELYAPLDLSLKAYSGLTDESFANIADLDSTTLGIGQPEYEEFHMLFLPEQAETFKKALEGLLKRERGMTLVSHYRDFDAIFDAIVATKKARNVHNTAVALRVMADLAMERILELEQGDAAA